MLGMNEVSKYSIGIKLIFFKIKVYIKLGRFNSQLIAKAII
jgi:hypothetical protein